MKKTNFLTITFLTAPLAALLLFAQSEHKNLIYLHEQKKECRSARAHLGNFADNGNVVLDFYADWCPPCRRMSPLIDSAAAIMPNVTFIKINRDFFLDLASEFKITSIPTLIFLHNGVEVGRYDGGPLTEKKLKQLILAVFKPY